MNNELFYLISLTQAAGIGPTKARLLLRHFGSAEEVFKAKNKSLLQIQDIGPATIRALTQVDFKKTERELNFIDTKGVRTCSLLEDRYPQRLLHCDDAPILLYGMGNYDWNPTRSISVVGTRKATSYGKSFCTALMQAILPFQPTVVSGLAYGIDYCAHTSALEYGLPTIACVAHGLEKIYPDAHRALANRMIHHGGIITEFTSHTPMAPEMFPMRNRLIAGLGDCTVVVETDLKGGSMITAHIASSYGRDVFALPGRYTDKLNRGCHTLIKRNIAAILTAPEDIIDYMGWNEPSAKPQQQLRLFNELEDTHRIIASYIQQQGKPTLDAILEASGMNWAQLNSALMGLEFDGFIRSLPGKRYEIIG
jgi:DNA processing protein